MNRRAPILATVVVLAALLAGRAAGGPGAGAPRQASRPPVGGGGLAATPTPRVLVGELDPLPDGCSPERVLDIVLEFLDAFNRGDQDRLAALFRPDVLDADGTPDFSDRGRNPGWFSAPSNPSVLARSDAELLPWAAQRHARGERWTLLDLAMSGYWWRGGVNIGVDLRREADDLPVGVIGGKGAIDCDDGTVFLWNVGSDEVLPDSLFDPNATPGVGFVPASRRP